MRFHARRSQSIAVLAERRQFEHAIRNDRSGANLLLIADAANSRLLGWESANCETGSAATLLTGQPDFHAKGDNRWQSPVRDSLCWPYGVAASGNIVLICDSGNNRIALWQLEKA